jgi:hypothetical protein
MTTIARATGASTAEPAAFFAIWADVATWPEWNSDIDWVRLDGPFAEGTTGKLKPKGGPAVKYAVDRLVPGRQYRDVSKLIGARLHFDHVLGRTDDGRTSVQVEISMTGPLRGLWMKIMGNDLAKSVQHDLDNLIATAEKRS